MTSKRDRILENVRLAAGCGATPTLLLTVALASTGARTIDEALATLGALGPELSRLEKETPRPHSRLAEVEPTPEVARMRPDLGDHELRGQLVFADLLGKKSFIQVAALAVAGVALTRSDADLLDDIGVLAQLADPRIWPLAVTRTIATNGGTLAEAVVAGIATLCTRQMTGIPSAELIRFLERIEPGQSVEEVVRDALERGERIPGVGRPVLRGDERVRPMLATMSRYGRLDGPSMRLALELDAVLAREKGLGVNSAGFCGALMRDLGFSANAAAAFCLIYFIVPILTHAAARARLV